VKGLQTKNSLLPVIGECDQGSSLESTDIA
jgi:hypothetical protein